MPPRQRLLSPKDKETLRRQVSEWLAKGVILETPPQPWTNNLVFVAKASGAIRTCIDCTPANKVTSDFDWPLPRLQDLRHHLVGARWFTRRDLRDAFFRIGVPSEYRHLTSFESDGRTYSFQRMPFGLKTAPSTFQRFMDHGLCGARDICFWYMDDVLTFGRTLKELRRNDARVASLLASMRVEINETKSEYEKQGLLFAGLWVGGGVTGPNHRKVEQVLSTPPPRTKEQKQSALGLVSYLRDFVPLASHFTAELSTSAGNLLDEAAYAKEWKRLLMHVAHAATTLVEWDESADADLYTDASGKACSAVLLQHGRIVALSSRKLTPAETRYSTTDREHLGLLLAAKKFRVFLHRPLGETRVWSDHAALLTRKIEEMTPRQCRWHVIVTTWIPTARHVRGKENPADFFSRWSVELIGGQIFAHK